MPWSAPHSSQHALGSTVHPVGGTPASRAPGASLPRPTSRGVGPASPHAPLQVHTSHTTRQLDGLVSPQIAGSQQVAVRDEHAQAPSMHTKSYVQVVLEPSIPLESMGVLGHPGTRTRSDASAPQAERGRSMRMGAAT